MRQSKESYKLLRAVKALKLKLDNGTSVTVRLHEEFALPNDKSTQTLSVELAKANASLAFWSHQVVLAGQSVRTAERRFKRRRGNVALWYRKKIQSSTAFDTREFRLIEDACDADPTLGKKQRRIDGLKYHYDLLVAIRECVRQKIYSLGRMLDARSGRKFNEP